MSGILDPVLPWIAAAALALILARGAALKLLDLPRFSGAVAAYRIVPAALVAPAAGAVVAGEAAAASLLLVPDLRRLGATLAALVLAVVSAGVWINLRRGRFELDCGCGGKGQRISAGLLARNAGLGALALLAAIGPVARPLGTADLLVIAAASLAWAGLYFAGDALLASWRTRAAS
jgi:hypothetical protein